MADVSDIRIEPTVVLPSLLGVDKIEHVLYNPNGSRKTLAEVTAICCGEFDSRFCSGVEDFYNRKDFRCFLGYTHIQLSVDFHSVLLNWQALSEGSFTVTCNKPWSITGYGSSSFFTLDKTAGGAGSTAVTVRTKNNNTGALLMHGNIEVRSGSKSVAIQIVQDNYGGTSYAR